MTKKFSWNIFKCFIWNLSHLIFLSSLSSFLTWKFPKNFFQTFCLSTQNFNFTFFVSAFAKSFHHSQTSLHGPNERIFHVETLTSVQSSKKFFLSLGCHKPLNSIISPHIQNFNKAIMQHFRPRSEIRFKMESNFIFNFDHVADFSFVCSSKLCISSRGFPGMCFWCAASINVSCGHQIISIRLNHQSDFRKCIRLVSSTNIMLRLRAKARKNWDGLYLDARPTHAELPRR